MIPETLGPASFGYRPIPEKMALELDAELSTLCGKSDGLGILEITLSFFSTLCGNFELTV